MEGQRPCSFPVLVRGDWGPAEPPPALRKKLLCYFQSQKRSGGGECELRTGTDTGTGTGHIILCFARPEVRERVLRQPVHELVWGSGGQLSLQVTALPADGDPAQEAGPAGGTQAPVNEPQVSLPICQNKETPVCTQQEKTESCEKLEAEKATSRNSVVVTTAFGEEIEDEILEMYFENKRKSGGGTIESYVKKDEQVIITFQNEQDAQEVLQRKHHLNKIDLVVKPWQVETSQELCQVENSEGSLLPTSVVLENVKETIKDCMLTLLVENVSGLSEEDGDFSVEMIPELCAAVVTFTGNTDAEEFAKKLNKNPTARKQNITARCLEQTKSVRAENIPPNTPSHYITVYFENERYGGAQTVDVQLLPDEDAAIVTFGYQKDVTNILAKKHSLNKTPIFVYPYYTSLETALYGKEGPQIKKPDPITLPLDPYIWSYLQGNSSLIEAIDHEMAKCNCVPAWPGLPCADPKVTLHPSAIFSERKRSVSRLAKAWKEKVSTAFSHSISKYEAIQCQISTEVWEAIRNRFPHDEVLMIPHISKDLHVLVGEKEVVKKVEQELKLLIQKATREIEREKQRTELKVKRVNPGEYGILQITGVEEKFRTEFPDLHITYDYLQKCINLSGVPEEVYKVKGEILDHVHKMATKTVNIHPYIFQFLEHIDNETLSQSLFVSKQISAFYELGAGKIILKGSDPENLLKAEEEIKKELDHKSITLDDESVLQKEEWQMLAKENCSNGAVAVTQAETQVMIAGLSEAVAKAFEELSNFIDENTQVQRVIEGKPMALIKFFEKEKVNVWAPLQEKGVKVDFVTQKICEVISLSGPKTKVLEGVSLVERILSGLHFKRVVIDLPGAKAYIKDQADFLDPHIKQVFKCLILLEEQPEKQLEEQKVHSNRGKLCMQVTMGTTVIVLYEADLCTHPVDVVVNASNEDLRHIGGLADALSRAAGPALQQECNELVRKLGNLQPGCAVITGAGKLPCKNVIHAVGPRWNEKESQKCTWLLKKTVKKCLQLAEAHKHCSIALPAISGGIFGFPLEVCTYSIVSSIKETLEESKGNSSLKEVHLVGFAQDNIQAFRKAFREVFPDSLPSYRSRHHVSTAPQPKQRKTKHIKNFPVITTQEGLNVVLQIGSIEDATTSIVVVSVGKDLQLDKGPLGKALLSKAGPMLQTGLNKEGGGRTAEDGSVLKTKGYNLACSVVLHAVVPAWSQKNTPSKILGDIITKCLEIAEELSLKSITFPAIGTGNLEFPRSVVAKLFFDKVFEFSSKNRVNSLEEVHFLLHKKDTANIQEFSDELENRSVAFKGQKPPPNDASQSLAFSAISSASAHNVLEVTIGSLVFRVAEGDITKEEGDAIVNITNVAFNLKTGVSRAILNGAGKAVEDECAVLAQQTGNKYIITQAGNLPCKNIIHFVYQDDIRSLVSQVLQECELRQYTSVAFPAIGTGEARRNPAEVADNMIDAVTDFAKRNSATSVKTIKVVIFQPYLMSVFQTSMQKREKSTATRIKSFVSKAFHMGKSLWSSEKHSPKEKPKRVLEKKIDMAVVQICGEDKKEVEEAEKWLRNAISKEQSQTEIVDEYISHFGEEEREELDDLEEKFRINLDLKSTSIEISGVTKDVCLASLAVDKMILRVKAAKETEAKLLQNSIEWKYFEKDSYVPFNSLTNMDLENAYKGEQKTIDVTIGERIYTVDMDRKTAVDAQGGQIPIIRIDKSEDQKSIVLPPMWDPMENERVKIVELKPDSREYKDVQERFLQTCQSFKIEKIERVQNRYLWKNYQIKKCEMDKKNGDRNNERLLFHGTSQESLPLINDRGFNRSYAGMNAANFGNGTYFAVNAKYSAQDLYSKPDVNGKKYMYLARVLVGEYSLGKKGSITPARKNVSDSVDLFDSSTDNISQPSMFIIFNDIQAYPEYLITFTRPRRGEESGAEQIGAAMEGQRPCSFPVLVRGDWGPAEPPPALRKKLLCYFQSQKRSGGGECELRTGTDTGTGTGQIIVCFARPEDDTKTMKKAESFVPNSEPQEDVDSPEASPSVVFEKIERCNPNLLQILLESISGLDVDTDFTIELIPERNVAVATFIRSIDTKEFVKKCSQHKRVREFKMTVRLLESTQTIKAENLPDSISTDYLTVYFENARNGGGPVSDVQLFPEENSAIITFCDHKAVAIFVVMLQTDVVVNSVGTDLEFGVGPLCKALLGRAGPALRDEFDTAVKSQVAGPGNVLCTSGCAMACKSILHAILPKWDGEQSEKVLEDVINFCLKKTEELGLKSITFPAIGTGGFGFPKTIVSKLMFDVTFRFSSSHTRKNLQEVHFLLSPQDIDNIQAFTTELELRADESCNAAAAQPSFVRRVSAELLGVHEMKIGSITLQVISGDITKEDTEVIVNISNPSFNAKTGVFKAIMDAAGAQVADECAQYAGQYENGFITTQGGNLLCSKIIHLITNNQVKSQVSKVLHECERKMYKSVAFPAIGTGQARQSSAKVADEMLDAIVEFTRQKSVQHLQTIKIVIFQTNMLKDFYESMKKREDTDSSTTESWLSMFKSFFWGRKQSSEKKKFMILEKKVNLVTFQICGESQEKVDATESWIKNLILKELFETTISDEAIESFDETQIKILEDLPERKRVTIRFLNNLSPPQIKISGISRDVYAVSLEVQNMIQQIKSTEEQQSKAELLYNLVEWRYPGSNDSFVAFDKLTNMQLEYAKMSKKLHLNVEIKKKNYKVDLNTLQATDEQGKTINLQRVMKDEDMQFPKEWIDMQNEQVKVVELQPSYPEYKRIEKIFKKTCADFNIEKIERIQNRILWQTYQLKKKSICEKNKNQNNEKLLFHGTAASSLRLINCCGFDRGHAGKNAAAIGNGTYFAVNARYSAQDTYSVPDVNGKKYMYLARVLTGEYCVGKGGLKTPPPRSPADPTDLYDSVVDDQLNPTMFVIFSDIQAYPQYLITFK
ncbi:hypothetical protein Nmel_009570 [Mimus melanotis]